MVRVYGDLKKMGGPGHRTLCVLGMHRTGTSLTTRVANLLGARLGPDDALLEARQGDNPSGFWEVAAVNDLNDEILARLGGEWRQPPELSAGWAQAPQLDDLRERARRVLVELGASEAPLWAFKDPRVCLTLPFWVPLLTPMRCVLTIRSPLEVARSLKHRNDLPEALSFALWLRYTADALLHSTGRPRLLVRFDGWLEDPEGQLRALASFIGPAAVARRAAIRIEALDFIQADLRHHASDPGATLGEPRLHPAAKALFLGLEAAARDGAPELIRGLELLAAQVRPVAQELLRDLVERADAQR
jgi:hypothetical protein